MGLFIVRVLGFGGPINLHTPKLVRFLAFLSFSNVARAKADHGSMHDKWDDGFLSSSHRILSTYDKCVLTLCCAVLFICAVALLVQACRILVDIARKERLWRQEEYLAQEELLMSALEAGYGKAATLPRYATRFGDLSEQEIDRNGVRKVVLVVNETYATNAAQDAYADWFVRWCHLQEEASNYAVEGSSDGMSPLIDVGSPTASRYLGDVVPSSQGPLDRISPLIDVGSPGVQQDLDGLATSPRPLLAD
ncbi:hypothetical protein ANOM_011027 [Aspergillus nomiae NRRL 13137]|uniref:Uncharacterized protein n=1 Tax=Aspergillus nomiae NRRL (strain ATCC 15546 / NRRL 13137 / CBS 260.88 / M93) TaxID=1509407 RepID=A0A0L1INR5_ASPN3|nr:uncharacterized protein ANOM_011027 [Aspergillus nomiae NRRL 13137]KNG80945.1 hypothetical protein ANOM_011027 [Aspergillus nomiae NRRL 13137]